MKNKILSNFIISIVIAAVSFVITLVAYSHIPDEVTFLTNTLVAKSSVAYVLPIATAIAGIVLSLLPLIYRLFDKSNMIAPKSYHTAIVIITGALLFMQIVTLCNWLDFSISLSSLAIACFGFLVALVGNFMPRFRKGALLAIYNPWTSINPIIWRKAHRVGGYVWLVGGIAIIFMVLVPQAYNLWIVIAIFVLCIAIPHLYSYLIGHKKDKKNA